MEDFLNGSELEKLIPIFSDQGIGHVASRPGTMTYIFARKHIIENDINMENIGQLTDDMLRELIPNIGTRMKFIQKRDELKLQNFDIMGMPIISTSSVSGQCSSSGMSDGSISTVSIISDQFEPESESTNITVPTQNRTISFYGSEMLFTQEAEKNFPSHGGKILNFYRINDTLLEPLRNRLVEIIITHVYSYLLKHRLTHSQYNILCSKILHLFPSENASTYYQPSQKSNGCSVQAKGKLVYKAHNVLYQSPDKVYMRKRTNNMEGGPSLKNIRTNITEDEKNCVLWLKHHREPWSDVVQRWNDTFQVRKNSSFSTVAEFVEEWPIIGDPRAGSLIETDFEKLHEGKGLLLLKNWSEFFEQAVTVRKESIINSKDPHLNNILEILNLSENLTESSRVALQIQALPRIIPPKGRTRRGAVHWKFSTVESVEGIIVHATGPGDIERTIEGQRRQALKRKLHRNVQPYLLVEGPQLCDIVNVYIVIDKVRFHVENTLKGLDILFKSFFVLNAQYPVQSEMVWYIIQQVIYDIPAPPGKITGNAIDLLGIKFKE